MKIFISHSSKDKWAARRISEDLIKKGLSTFLDEKDIKTGQTISLSINEHLKDCDDFLIIISPASIKSEWVLIELGGAIALNKNIIPILLYVGANEIPQIINLKLARDINDIEIYYEEAAKKIKHGKEVTVKKAATKKRIERVYSGKLKIGQKVKVISYKGENIYKGPMLIDWEEEMNAFMGQETIIRGKSWDETYLLDIDKNGRGGGFVWAQEWLIPIHS
jgi:hypothetical protein